MVEIEKESVVPYVDQPRMNPIEGSDKIEFFARLC